MSRGRKTLIWLTGNFPFDLDNPNSYLSPDANNQYQIVKPHGGVGKDGIAEIPTTQAFQVRSTSLIGTSDLLLITCSLTFRVPTTERRWV